MVWISISLRVRVAGDTGERRIICAVHVACGASDPHGLVVRSGIDGEPGVIERGPGPGGGVMAGLASGRKGRGNMVRVGGTRVLRLVARIAIRRCGREVSVDVTTGAGHRGVRSRQRKDGLAVIEG